MKPGRPIKYFTEEDRLNAIRKSKTKYMINKPWICEICDREYCLAGKWTHIKSKLHYQNCLAEAYNNINDFNSESIKLKMFVSKLSLTAMHSNQKIHFHFV